MCFSDCLPLYFFDPEGVLLSAYTAVTFMPVSVFQPPTT